MKNIRFCYYLTFVILSFYGCSTNSERTDKEKITELIMEYAKNNIPDYESFEIIEMLDWDSTYTEISKEKIIHNHAQSYNDVISNIETSKNEIQRINNYLIEVDSYIDQALENRLNVMMTMGNEVYGYDKYGNPKRGVTMRGLNSLKRANNEVAKLEKYKSEALTMRKQEENRYRGLLQQEQAIKDEVKVFCSNWKKQYIGKSIQMKCRLKNNEGNMDIEVYDVLCNDSLSSIINVADTTERHSFDDVKKFILHCYN